MKKYKINGIIVEGNTCLDAISKIKDSNLSSAYAELKKYYPDAQVSMTNNTLIVKNINELGLGIKNFLTNLNKKYGRTVSGFGGRLTNEPRITNNEALLFISDSKIKDFVNYEYLLSEERKAVEDYKKAISETNDKNELYVFSHILKEEAHHIELLENLQKGKVTFSDSIKDEDKKV